MVAVQQLTKKYFSLEKSVIVSTDISNIYYQLIWLFRDKKGDGCWLQKLVIRIQ